MRFFRAIGMVTFGVLIGVGVTASAGNASAQAPSGRLTVVGPSTEWAGNYPFRFIKDTKTGACYLVGLSGGEGGGNKTTVTAITRTDDMSCF
jgi:hypothetical protein